MALSIIVDDTNTSSFTFGSQWSINTVDPWFNGTGHVQSNGQLSMTFNGTSVAFFGITPPASSSQSLSVSIDGSAPFKTSYNDPNPPSYRQWYQSPTLPEGSHNITLTQLAGTSVDFGIVTAGNDTPLSGQMAIVDNENPAITFKGNWKQNNASFVSSQIPIGLPFQNTTQDSTTIGDSFTFLFTGQSAAVYGVFNWSTLGLVTVTFTLDDSSLVKTFQVTSTTPQFLSNSGQEPNYQFYLTNFLTPGNHSLIVNVTDRVNQTFSFDYITFQPSFSTLANMPNLTSLAGSGASNSGSSRKFPIGAIVGIIVVAIALVSFVIFVTRRLKQRRRIKDNLVGVNPFFRPRTNNTEFPLYTRVVSSASDDPTRNAPNNYTAVDPDAPGRLNTLAVDGEHDVAEDQLPSYDESNRMTIVR